MQVVMVREKQAGCEKNICRYRDCAVEPERHVTHFSCNKPGEFHVLTIRLNLRTAPHHETKYPLEQLLPGVPGYEKTDLKSCVQSPGGSGLSECLNGFAEKIIPLGIKSQIQQNYVIPSSCQEVGGRKVCGQGMGVHITDFTSEPGGYGYYTIIRPNPSASIGDIKNGEAAVYFQKENDKILGVEIAIWKGTIVFQFLIDNAADYEKIKKISLATAAQVQSRGQKPEQLAFFPEYNREENSFQFTMADFPLFEELSNVVSARYQAANQEKYTLFVSSMGSAEKAKNAFTHWLEYSKKNNQKTEPQAALSLDAFAYTSAMGENHLVVLKNKYICGIFGKGITGPGQATADISMLLGKIP